MDLSEQDLYQQALYSTQQFSRSPYKDTHLAFPHHLQQQQYYDLNYTPYVLGHQQGMDEMFSGYGTEYADFMFPGMGQDEFGEMEEISTRPRLTKEQVEVLESQFQANHKPNSQVKRQLAIQTKLTLPRVANWFQNRRAKAKQQKKQEEFEAQNSGTANDSNGSTSSKPASAGPSSPTKSISSPSKRSVSSRHASPSPTRVRDTSKEASWASLQRALNSAKVAQATQPQPAQMKASMAPPGLPLQANAMNLPIRSSRPNSVSQHPLGEPWAVQRPAGEPYPSPITLQDTSFDFGFDQETFTSQQAVEQPEAPTDYSSSAFVVTPEDWDEPLATPKNAAGNFDPSAALPSPGLTGPSYPGSRRQSTTDDLSNNFGNFALASSSPNIVKARRQSETIRAPENGNLDIAARRKRPRPAPLTSSSLRSRSYGAMTSVSPTFRHGTATPQAPHTVRHVKSAGHGLNSRFAGVRKASSAQRSPMCVSTFAENEAFHQLMAQQAMAAQSLADLPQPMLSPGVISGSRVHEPEKNPFFAHNIEMPHSYQQSLHITTASPPITPLASDFLNHGVPSQPAFVPASAPPQYASIPDYTPPYSAGPMTNSSWSDAPLTSPDGTTFPSSSYMGYINQGDGLPANFQQFVLASDKTDLSIDGMTDHKKTEFYIQEFPNQRREHAHVAQQLPNQTPKSYTFANYAPQDYD
ncbi:hypothetical protein B0A52_06050 [Exophiala mesophila]|uniref:Homeobox domain-containing protein n=1 Tax=Exophiala mesophila TaxID=212818 RepID=A0A438N5E6_EXOME|nr:hypothetical protein B0A52_06050 [Exophiala mesophila]